MKQKILKHIKCTINLEAESLLKLAEELTDEYAEAVEMINQCRGRVIVTGIGKSGLVAQKIVATFASTGTPSFFVHPSEASHGDLGMITVDDVVIAISKSGNSLELTDILHDCKRRSIKLIGMTAKPTGELGKICDILLAFPDVPEACPLGLAPTTSTSMCLAIGDALALSIMSLRKFDHEQFKSFHPGGSLGRRLIKLKDIMHTADQVPLIHENSDISSAILEMSAKRLGCVGLIDSNRRLTAVFTDGDLRRIINRAKLTDSVLQHASSLKYLAQENMDVGAALAKLKELTIPSIFIIDEDGRTKGIVHYQDFLKMDIV